MTVLDETERAIRSARSTGAVGKNAIVPRIIPQLASRSPDLDILDFGCGKDMIHVKALREKGYSVDGYDLSLPETKEFIKNRCYDIIYLSNVLNIQSSEEMLEDLINDVWYRLHHQGFVVANYPKDPRYLGWSTEKMLKWLQFNFASVVRVNRNLAGKNIVWILR